jgi:hypothetical protein
MNAQGRARAEREWKERQAAKAAGEKVAPLKEAP